MPPRKKRAKAPALVVGIAGGSASGKTTLARSLDARLGDACALLPQDLYYHDVAEDWIPPEHWNYDHPDALDLDLMVRHLRSLKVGVATEVPCYDFGLYRRTGETRTMPPAGIVIVEGTLVLFHAPLRDLCDIRVFIEAPDDIRFIRRLRRDTLERGRDMETVIRQYTGWNRPMHQRFVQPSREHAQIILPNGGLNSRSVDILVGAIRELRPNIAVLPAEGQSGAEYESEEAASVFD